jgi:hypothetical protein
MDEIGYRPATLAEVLALRVAKQFPIVALGSVWQFPGGRRVPCLDWDGSERSLDLGWFESGWRVIYRFAAVRK